MSTETPVDLKKNEVPATDAKATSTNDEAQNALYIDPKDEARVVRKLDLFLTPILFVVYLSCFIDRANIGTWKPNTPRALSS